MPNVAGVTRPRHARKASRNRTAIARSQELPLLQRKVSQLVEPDEQELRTLIAINIVLVAAVTKARGRAITPSNDGLCFVVAPVQLPGNVAAKIRQQR